MKTNLSVDIAVIISLFTAFFYACGQNYLAAYMAVFYIDPVILNFPTAEKINWGFLNCGNWLTFILLSILILSFILYIFALLNIKYPNSLKIIFKSKKQSIPQIHNQNITDEQRANRIRIFFWSFFLCLLGLSAILTFVAIDIRTREAATNVFAYPNHLPVVKANGKEFFLIKCGSSLCALIDEKRNVSLIEPKNIVLLGSNFKNK